MAVEETLEVRS